MSDPREALARIVAAQKRYGEVTRRKHVIEDDRIEAVDECDAAIENTNFAAILAEWDRLVAERDDYKRQAINAAVLIERAGSK